MSVVSSQPDQALDNDQLTGQQSSEHETQWAQVPANQWAQQLSALLEKGMSPESRLYWMTAMRQWFDANIKEQPLPPGQTTLSFANANIDHQAVAQCLLLMRNVAYQLCDWGFLIKTREAFDIQQALNPNDPKQSLDELQTIAILQLAAAYWQMGQLQQAEQLLLPLVPRLDEDNPLLGFAQQVHNDRANLPEPLVNITDNELRLIPLEEQHFGSFYYVYQDPQIAKLCNLPDFQGEQDWLNWLAGYQMDGHSHLFAVNHDEYGFIGSVFISVHNGVGFFYYWLGQDFQGKGFGPRAVKRLLQFGREVLNMQVCYSKVYAHNMPSQQGMNKIGFKRLPVTLEPPNDDQLYFYLGEDKPANQQRLELQQLIDALDFVDVLTPLSEKV